MTKTETLLNLTREKILSGKYGPSGAQFPTIRDFAAEEEVSYLTAYHIFAELRDEGLLYLLKKRWFLCTGMCRQSSFLGKHARKNLIGLHVKEINNPYITENIYYLEKILKKAGIQLLIQTSENDKEKEKEALRFFIEAGCSGVINFPSTDETLHNFYETYPLPMVFVGRKINKNLVSIITDNYGTGKHVAKFLLERGYTGFAFIGLQHLPDDSNERLHGFRAYLQESGIPDSSVSVFRFNLNDNTYVSEFLSRIHADIKKGESVGIFCLNDLLAYKVLKTLQKARISIPHQAGIVGYDNLPISTLAPTTITSISYDFNELSQKAYHALSEMIKTRTLIRNPIVIPNHIIVRNSTR